MQLTPEANVSFSLLGLSGRNDKPELQLPKFKVKIYLNYYCKLHFMLPCENRTFGIITINRRRRLSKRPLKKIKVFYKH